MTALEKSAYDTAVDKLSEPEKLNQLLGEQCKDVFFLVSHTLYSIMCTRFPDINGELVSLVKEAVANSRSNKRKIKALQEGQAEIISMLHTLTSGTTCEENISHDSHIEECLPFEHDKAVEAFFLECEQRKELLPALRRHLYVRTFSALNCCEFLHRLFKRLFTDSYIRRHTWTE